MKNSRYTPEQVAFGLHQAEEGTPVAEVCRKQGISEAPTTGGSQSTVGWRSQRPSG